MVLYTYFALLIPWLILSAFQATKTTHWNYTPKWHQVGVKAFRFFVLVSLPLEFILTKRPIVWSVFSIGLIGTLTWMLVRLYLMNSALFLSRSENSLAYNFIYVSNLVCFSLAMNSFFCLGVMMLVAPVGLLIRLRITYDINTLKQ